METVQRLIRAGAGDDAFAPVPGQGGQLLLGQAGQPAPVALRLGQQCVEHGVFPGLDDEDKGPGIGQFADRGLVIDPAVAFVIAASQQLLTGLALVFGVQHQGNGLAELTLFAHPLHDGGEAHDVAPCGRQTPSLHASQRGQKSVPLALLAFIRADSVGAIRGLAAMACA